MGQHNNSAMIEVRDLAKNYGDFKALRGVSFELRRGEILGLLGPNGAGKSTTMKILTGYLSASSGSVTVDGLDLFADSRAVRERIGYLPESTPIYGEMLVQDYLVYVAQMRGFRGSEARDRIAAVTKRVGIDHRLGSEVGALSKGLRQRVGLAQALLHDPRILILDEPTSGLDPNQIVEIRDLIRSLGEERSVILSTHILPEVRQTCDRLVIIHRGEVVADGTPEALEAEMAADHALLVGVTGSRDDANSIVDALRTLPGVDDASLAHASTEPFEHLLLEVSAREDVRRALFRWAAEGERELVELRRKRMDLEGIFQSLTQT